MSTPLIRASGLHKVYRTKSGRQRITRRALDGVSLEIGAGRRVALVGANGSGKSTLLRMLANIEEPDSGVVEHLNDTGEVIPRRAAATRMGVVFQSPGLDRLLTVQENLTAQAELYSVANPTERIGECASFVGLTDRLSDRVGGLSGGLARRADLARAMISRPSVLLLDEPLAGLDAESRDVFLRGIRELSENDADFTLVMSSHSPEEIRLADEVVVLEEGRVIACGEPAAIARERFGQCELIAILDGPMAVSADIESLRVWNAGAQSIVGGARDAVEAFALQSSRDGAAVELRDPDFVSAYRLMLAHSQLAGSAS